MDPNLAFQYLIEGFEIGEHASALHHWLSREGFAPRARTVPEECAPFLKSHCEKHYPDFDLTDIRVRADRAGLWTALPYGQWISAGIWRDLESIEEEE